MTAPSHEAQITEGQNRELVAKESPHTPPRADEIAAAKAVHDDNVRSDVPDPQQSEDSTQRQREPERPVDLRAQKRAEIVGRFRTDRAQDDAEGDDEFARSGTPEGFEHPVPSLQPEPEPEPETVKPEPVKAEPDPEPQPQKKKVKVRGHEYEVTEEEYHAAAQKGLAGDNYLDEAKTRLNQADELYRDLQNRARHPGQTGEHHASPEVVQPGQRETETPQDPQHPEEDAIAKAIELIQYGDPTEAKQFLNTAVEQTAARIAKSVITNTLQSQKAEDEATKTQRELKEFEDQHQDLAKDKRARAAIEATVFDLQVDDLKAIGINPDTLRQDGRPATPADIAEAHRICRTRGLQVRQPGEILRQATDDFLEWRGTPKGKEPAPADPNPHPQPTRQVEVQVDRTQRRATIPQQPSRSAAPQRQMVEPVPQAQDRSSIVESIKAQRAKPRGKVLGA